MSIVNQSRYRYSRLRSQGNLSNLISPHLINRSLSAKKLFRQYPLLAAFHKATDGVLVGLLLIVVVMSAIALHSQHLWNVSFSRLETSRGLIQKLRESTSVLESHYLTSRSLSKYRVGPVHPKNNLIYLERPLLDSHFNKYGSANDSLLERLVYYPVRYGY